MRQLIVGALLCLGIAAGVEISGVGRLLSLHRLTPPQVPERWAALPAERRVDLALVRQDLLTGLAAGLSRAELALERPGAIALVDGRVFASNVAPARGLLETLAWQSLPITVRQLDGAATLRFAAPAPASLAWRAQRDAYTGMKSAREWLAAYPGFSVTALASAILLMLHALVTGVPRWRLRQPELEAPVSPWRLRRRERPVRVVLVPDPSTLAQLRMAIGEENVVAATEHAFAFSDGWILASRKGSVFELMGELGWRMRPLEMATRSELVGEGHGLSPLPGDDGGDTLGLLEALRVCGPIAHGDIRRSPLLV